MSTTTRAAGQYWPLGISLQADHRRTTRAADCGVVRVGSRSADCNIELDWIKQTLNRPCITECSAWVVQNVMLNLVGEKRKGKERKERGSSCEFMSFISPRLTRLLDHMVGVTTISTELTGWLVMVFSHVNAACLGHYARVQFFMVNQQTGSLLCSFSDSSAISKHYIKRHLLLPKRAFVA